MNTDLKLSCVACGRKIRPGDQFCVNCGAHLTPHFSEMERHAHLHRYERRQSLMVGSAIVVAFFWLLFWPAVITRRGGSLAELGLGGLTVVLLLLISATRSIVQGRKQY